MAMDTNTISDKALLLSKNEKAVLSCFPKHRTPLAISRQSGIPRPTVYITLSKLKKRGLVQETNEGKKKYWVLINQADVTPASSLGKFVKTYTDPKVMGQVYEKFISGGEHRLKSLLGNDVGEPWRKAIGEKEIVRINEIIKKRQIIAEVVSSMDVYNDHAENFGKKWIDSYTGRPFRVSIIDPKYLAHKGQVFIYGKKMFFINMEKPIIIEISDPEIVKMMESVLQFFHDKSNPTNIEPWLKERAQ